MTKIFNQTKHREKRVLLRRQMPPAELLLWKRVRNKQLAGLKFRSQHGVGAFVVDFFCAEARLAVELDGESHRTDEAVAYDAAREAYMESVGIRTLRIPNEEVFLNMENVLEVIVRTVRDLRAKDESE